MAEWDYKTVSDPMTDVKRGIASIAANEQNGLIAIKCDRSGPGSLYLHFIATNYLGKGRSGSRDIEYRVDGSEVQKLNAYHDKSMAIVTNNAPNDAGGRFIKQLRDANKLVIALYSYEFERYVSTFDISGAREAIRNVVSVCEDSKWYAAFNTGPAIIGSPSEPAPPEE